MSHNQNSPIAPVAPSDRIEILDILRGFALFGILIMNIINFSGYDFASDVTKCALSTFKTDQFLINSVRVFFEGKFYTIFSILFGIGFSIIMVRLKSKLNNWKAIFYRRLLILSMIGYLHLQFLWSGDILLAYALMGFLLPLFSNVSDEKLMIIIAGLLAISFLIHIGVVISGFIPGQWLENMGLAIDVKNGIPEDDSFATYPFNPAHGWPEFWNWVQPGPLYRLSDLLNSNRFFKILALFLLGYYIGRKEFAHYLEANRPKIKRITRYGFIIESPRILPMCTFIMTE